MKSIKYLSAIIFTINSYLCFASNDSLKTVHNFNLAYDEIIRMLEGTQPLDFEKAIFITENAYHNNRLSYELFQSDMKTHTQLIQELINMNNQEDSIDFSVKIDLNKPYDINTLNYTEEEKREMYQKALTNWAIYKYITDTLPYPDYLHIPFKYEIKDPFGMNNWSNSQVVHLIGSKERKGNCFALTSLFKLFSERLNSGAEICIAPQHIYIQHQDHKGDWYNVELATGTHPSDGSIQTLTFTYLEAIQNGIALRRLDLKQDIALCLVYLGKSYEHKFNTKTDDFILNCAETALKYDSKNLNALLLKHQVLAERVSNYAKEKNLTDINQLQADKEIEMTYKQLEEQTLLLYNLGYHQMPQDMQKMILAGLSKDNNQPIMVENKTPNPFTTIEVAPEDRKYSTLSGGLFEELHPIRKHETYGNFVLDTEERKLVKMNLDKNKIILIDPVAFAWSIDPLAHEFPSWSPYAAFADNPIFYTDPDGRAVRPVNADANLLLNTALGSFGIDAETFSDALKLTPPSASGVIRSNLTIEGTLMSLDMRGFKRHLRDKGIALNNTQLKDAYNLYNTFVTNDVYELGVFVKPTAGNSREPGESGTEMVSGQNISTNELYKSFSEQFQKNPSVIDDVTNEEGYGVLQYEGGDQGTVGTVIIDATDKTPTQTVNTLNKVTEKISEP